MKHLKKLIILPIFILSSCGTEDLSSSINDSSTHIHDFNVPTYAWADDYSTVTASRVCKEDSTHVETETVNTTYVVTNATCTEDGSTIYTSEAFTNTAFSVQTKTIAIDKLGHDHEVSYSWSNDHLSVTATATCKNNNTHVITETVPATGEVITASTCTVKGNKKYTSSAFENSLFSVQTYDEELDYAAHTYHYDSVDDDKHIGTCTVCGHETNEEHHYELIEMVWADRINKVNYIGHRTYKCSDCEHEYIEYHWEFQYEF